jgi:hypothetical protein
MGTRRRAALLALAALAVAGCGGDDEDEDPVEGTGYTYSVPDGWQDVSDRAEKELDVGGFRPDSLVIGDSEDDFATNVNVIREDGVPEGVTAAQYADVSIAGLRDPVAAGLPPEVAETIEDIRPEQISRPSDAELGGEEAVAWDYRSTQDGRNVRVRQVAAVMDGAGYTVTLTVLPARLEEGSGALDEVVESWSWE